MPFSVEDRVVVCLLASLLSVPQQLRGESQPPFISFQVPDSRATYPLSINEAATVTGYYISNSGVSSGFVRHQDGQIITFDVPGSIATIPVSINTAGDITGYYNLPSKTPVVFDIPQGFVRTPDGKITTFGNPVTTASSSSFWAQPVTINVAGEIIGNYPDVALASVVFLRSAAGVVLNFSLESRRPLLHRGYRAERRRSHRRLRQQPESQPGPGLLMERAGPSSQSRRRLHAHYRSRQHRNLPHRHQRATGPS